MLLMPKQDLFPWIWLSTASTLETTHDISFWAPQKAVFSPLALKGQPPAGTAPWQEPCRAGALHASFKVHGLGSSTGQQQIQPGNQREQGVLGILGATSFFNNDPGMCPSHSVVSAEPLAGSLPALTLWF